MNRNQWERRIVGVVVLLLFVLPTIIVTDAVVQAQPRTHQHSSFRAPLSPNSSSLLGGDVYPPLIIEDSWTSIRQWMTQAIATMCQPTSLINDRFAPEIWYIGCNSYSNPLAAILRYSVFTNQTDGILNQTLTNNQGLQLMKQDELGRLWLILFHPDDSIGYIINPTTATNQTNPIMIPHPAPPSPLANPWSVWDLATKGNIAFITLSVWGATDPVTLFSIDLTTFNLTVLFTLSNCSSGQASYDALLDAFLIGCGEPLQTPSPLEVMSSSSQTGSQMIGIVAFPATESPQSSYMLVPGNSSFIPEAFLRVKSNDLFIYFTAPYTEMCMIAWSNQTTYAPIMKCRPKVCPGMKDLAYSPLTDTILVTCEPTDESISNLLVIQTTGPDALGVSAVSTTQAITLTALCNAQVGGPFTAQLDPFSSGGLVGLCGDGVKLIRGQANTVLVSSPTCGLLDQLATDSMATDLIFANCDQNLLVVDGPNKRMFQVMPDGFQMNSITPLTTNGSIIIVSIPPSTAAPALIFWLVSPITHEMVVNNIPPTSTLLFNFSVASTQDASNTIIIVKDLLVLWINNQFEFFNLSTGGTVPIPTVPSACDSGISGAELDEYFYLLCWDNGATLAQLNLLQPSLGWITIGEIDPMWESVGTVTTRPSNHQLYFSAADENNSLNLFVFNCTNPGDITATIYTLLFFSEDPYTIEADQTSNLVFFYDPQRRNQPLMHFDERTLIFTLVDIDPTVCDDIYRMDINQYTGVLYLTCLNGNLVALSKDFTCQDGYQWIRQQQCQTCPIGSARGMIGANQSFVPQCQQCRPGTIAIQPGSTTCVECSIGRFQDLTLEEQVCSYCQPGTYQNQTGQTECVICPAGQFSTDVGQTSCQSCSPGSYTQTNTSSTCELCARGTASNLTGLDQPCPICPSGSEQLLYGGTTCTPCQLGSYASSGDPCTVCAKNTYQPVVGAKCQPCDGPDQIGLECESGLASVNEGYFAYQIYDPSQQQWIYATTACPPSFCPGSHLQSTNSTGVNGTDDSIRYCTFPRFNSPNNLLCAECEDGYIVWGQECVNCSGTNTLLLSVVVFFLFLLVIFLLRSSTESAGHLTILLYFIQIAALELHQPVDESEHSSINWLQVFNLSFLSFNTCFAPLTPIQQILLTYASPFILFGVLIVIGLMHRLLQEFQPLRRMIGKFSFNRYISCTMTILLFCYTNVTVMAVRALHCVHITADMTILWTQPTIDCSSNDYHNLFIVTICCLVVYILGFPLVTFLFLLHRSHTKKSSVSNGHERTIEISQENNLSESLTAAPHFVSGPNNGSAVSSPLAESKDPTHPREIVVDDSESIVELTLSSVDGRTILNDFDLRWGALYLTFTSQSWYWQPWILVRRFAFALASVLITSAPLAFALFTGLNLVSGCVHLLRQPFRSSILNRIDAGAHFLLMVISIILSGSGTNRPLALQFVILAFIIPPTVAFGLYTLRHHLKRFKAALKHRQARAGLKLHQAIVGDLSNDLTPNDILHSRSIGPDTGIVVTHTEL